jgi:hypothetical protein
VKRLILSIFITLIVVLSWAVMHEQYHIGYLEDMGCKTYPVRLSLIRILEVPYDCPLDINKDMIRLGNLAVDGNSQMFGPLLFVVFSLSYILLKETG